jgi:hypothetical protein
MENLKQPLSIKVIYWFTQIAFWFFVLVFFASIVFAILLQFEFMGHDLQIHTNLPAEVNYTEKGSMNLFGEFQELEFVEATGKIHFIKTNPKFAKWLGYFLVGVISLSLYIFLQFKRFIVNVYRGFIFERFNIRMLRNMSYGLVGFWVFMILYSRLFYYFIARKMEFEHIVISGDMNSYGFLLIFALFLWVLSHIFMLGVKLQKEQELTV